MLPQVQLWRALKDLCELLGNDTLQRLRKAKNLNYESEMTMNEMVRAIGLSLEEEILLEARASPYFSLILDEATDISVNKQLGLCIQYLLEGGFIKVRNIKLLEVKSGSAEVITEAILQYITSTAPVTLDLKCLAGGSSDGASVMIGKHTGVMTRLQEAAPQGFISTHCIAHRLALAASDACKAVSMVARFERIVNQIYTYFAKSSTHAAELQEMQRVMNEPKLKLKRAAETRWLSHESAVDALRRSLKAVKATLEEEAREGDATARGLALELSRPNFIALLLLMSDVLSVLGHLSQCFQIATLNLLSVEQILDGALSALQALKESPLQGGFMLALEDTLKDLEITEDVTHQFESTASQYVTAVIDNIRNRFPQAHTLTLLGYLDPRNVSKASPPSINELGNLMGVDGRKLWQEFLAYRCFAKNLPELSVEAAVQTIFDPGNKEALTTAYPLISNILAHIAVLPASSAHVERLFSTMKRIKTAQRNRLKTETLDCLIRISSEGPAVQQWNPIPALRKWESWGKRKLTTSTPAAAPQGSDSTDVMQ